MQASTVTTPAMQSTRRAVVGGFVSFAPEVGLVPVFAELTAELVVVEGKVGGLLSR